MSDKETDWERSRRLDREVEKLKRKVERLEIRREELKAKLHRQEKWISYLRFACISATGKHGNWADLLLDSRWKVRYPVSLRVEALGLPSSVSKRLQERQTMEERNKWLARIMRQRAPSHSNSHVDHSGKTSRND